VPGPTGNAGAALVVEATLADGTAAALKVGVPGTRRELGFETAALRLADGRGCAGLLRDDLDRDALLLERLGAALYEVVPDPAARYAGSSVGRVTTGCKKSGTTYAETSPRGRFRGNAGRCISAPSLRSTSDGERPVSGHFCGESGRQPSEVASSGTPARFVDLGRRRINR
jgi:hypothetical protein